MTKLYAGTVGWGVWVSDEIDAIHRSRDGGESWDKLDNGFKFPDIHDIAILNDNGRKLLAATPVAQPGLGRKLARC